MRICCLVRCLERIAFKTRDGKTVQRAIIVFKSEGASKGISSADRLRGIAVALKRAIRSLHRFFHLRGMACHYSHVGA